MASSSGSLKVCFNSTCKQAVEIPKPGWRCRTGALADLCDRCFAVYKNGTFCDTFHQNASGWRCCESCGKQIHCGCIVSFHMFVLLDAGGIECLNCAKSEYILTPNPTWPSSFNFQGPSERIRDISSRNWRSISGSGPVPWRKAPSLFNAVTSQPELQLTSYSLGKSIEDNSSPRLVNDRWRVGASEMIGDKVQPTGVQYDGQHNHKSFKDLSYKPFVHINATPLSSLPATFVAHDKHSEKVNVSGIHAQQVCPSPSVRNGCSNNNEMGPPVEPRGETRGRPQNLPRYFPRPTDQEIQMISGSSNAKITPLFEKVLTCSDVGKIGRLVLPKKYAETYLPPITQSEGIPLVVQDLNGKDWVLQYRFWLNNNSRMYVLEGVTSCIQSMRLQAGDTVTFSRLEPDGKLLMGFRKASLASPSDKGNETTNIRFHTHEEPSNDNIAFKSRNPDYAKRKKKAQPCSNSKQPKPNKEEILQLNVTLEQVQGLLRPHHTNASTIVLIEGVEFEDFQEAPVIGSPTKSSTYNVGSLHSMDSEPTPNRLENMLPPNNQENPESVKTIEGLDALADMAIQGGKATTRHPRHKLGCSCIICVQPPSSTKRPVQTPLMHHEVGNSAQNPNQLLLLYANLLGYPQMENNNQNTKTGTSGSFENDPNGENPSTSSFKSQNIDLNIQPDREDESSPVSDSIGIMSLVQESTQRYIRQQKLSINGVTNENHKNHGL